MEPGSGRLEEGRAAGVHPRTGPGRARRRGCRGPRAGYRGAQLDRLVDEDGEILVDFVGKLENLQADFATVCEHIGRPAAQVQHVNWTSRSHYSQFYDDWSRDAVAALYQRDIEAFDYEFETP